MFCMSEIFQILKNGNKQSKILLKESDDLKETGTGYWRAGRVCEITFFAVFISKSGIEEFFKFKNSSMKRARENRNCH